MVPGDIGAELADALRIAASSGELPGAAGQLTAAGTWRPAPPGEGAGPGTYATSVPIQLAGGADRNARTIAERLARALQPVPWIAAAQGSGAGYLTVTVTTDHLAALPARIVAAGQRAVPATPPVPDPAAAPDWERAWNAQHDALVARLTVAANDQDLAAEHPYASNRRRSADSPPGSGAGTSSRGPAGGPVAAAAAWSGADAVRYVLSRAARPSPAGIERQLGLPLDLDNPFVLVRYAHAHAASTMRWAAELAGPAGSTDPSDDRPLPKPAELALIDLLSWFSERLAAAARRRRPAELCAYLEQVASAYLHCAQICPALPFGGAAAPPDPAGPQAAARRELADAARVVVAGGLSLAGVSSPVRLFRI